MARAVRQTRIPVSDPRRGFDAIGPELGATIERVLVSGRYVHGPEHAAFEAELAAFLDVEQCLGVASGTDALQLALAAVGCVPGDEVVTAANAGGYATAAALRMGLRPVYADVDATTLGLSAATVEQALTTGARAVVATHLYGLMCDVEGIVDLCRDRGIAVVEDVAQAAGAAREGRRAGSFGDAGIFSFYPTKNLAAIGDGGAVATNDAGIAERACLLRQYGWRGKYNVSVSGGWNSRLDELQAAVLRVGLPAMDERNVRRRAIVRRYADALPAEVGRFVWADGEDFAAHLAVLLAQDRGRVRAHLDHAGIDTDVHYPIADYEQPAWKQDTSRTVTDHAVAHVVTVPCFPDLTDDEVEHVAEVLGGL